MHTEFLYSSDNIPPVTPLTSTVQSSIAFVLNFPANLIVSNLFDIGVASKYVQELNVFPSAFKFECMIYSQLATPCCLTNPLPNTNLSYLTGDDTVNGVSIHVVLYKCDRIPPPTPLISIMELLYLVVLRFPTNLNCENLSYTNGGKVSHGPSNE